jgi:hypothetical protein
MILLVLPATDRDHALAATQSRAIPSVWLVFYAIRDADAMPLRLQ